MKNFVKVFLVFLMLIYGQQAIAADKCDRANAVDTSTVRTLRNSYEKQIQDFKIDSLTKKWEQTATIIFVISIFLIVCGAAITCLQLGNSRAITIVVAILGVCVSLLSLYRDELPHGTYKAYQKAIQDAEIIKSDLYSYLIETSEDTLNPDLFKKTIVSICEKVEALKMLKSNYSTNLPFPFGWFVSSANAAPEWWSDTRIVGIRASGTGSSRIEAKDAAEKQGLFEIQKEIKYKVDAQLKQPIFSSLKQGIIDASMLAVHKESESFEGTNPVTYWVLYQIDSQFVDNILNGVSFPLVIFNTDLIESKIKVLNKDLTEYGFKVTEQPSPRGAGSMTDAIFVGSGVPIDAIKKTVELLVKAGIPIKTIIYPWKFNNSPLEEKQKFNHVQIGGIRKLQSPPNVSEESLEKLKTITSRDEMETFCKESTEELKKTLGLAR